MKHNISEVRANILKAVEDGVRSGRPLSIREIGEAVGIRWPSQVYYHLNVLREKGYLAREEHLARSTRPGREPGVPIAGEIAAGQPLALFSDGEQQTLDVGEHLRPQPEQFALRVRGDSMIDDHIYDGDYILVRRDADVRNGAIVVAVDRHGDGERGAATVKRFYRERGHIRLQPANPEHEPRYIPLHEWAGEDRKWEVHGTVTAVYRPLAEGPAARW
jgi:repressor LexA